MRPRFLPGFALLLVTAAASAQTAPATPSSERAVTENSAESNAAAAHFEQALALYRAGKYRSAVAELEQALARDPAGKDLVFNLALVQEKLGDFDGAIASLHRFQAMEKDPRELERASQTIERLEGARAELAQPPPLQTPMRATPAPCVTAAPRRGKWDSWVMATGGAGVALFVVGTVFGLRALSLDTRGESTGPGTSFQSLNRRAESAHHAAIIADVALSLSVLAGASAATLYFGRFADVPSPRSPSLVSSPRVAGAWVELPF